MLQIKKVGISTDKRTKINTKSPNNKKELKIPVHKYRENEETWKQAEEFGELDEVKEKNEHLVMRCEALKSGRLDILDKVKKIQGTIKTKELQMENITKEQQKIRDFIKNLEGRIDLLENHKESYREKVIKWKEKEAQQWEKLKLIEATISSLKEQNIHP